MLESYEELIKSSIGEIGFSQIFVYIGLKFGLVFTGWAMLMMSIAGATPKWWSVGQQWNNTGDGTLETIRLFKTCPTSVNQTIEFDASMKSIVSQFGLVCDKSWIPKFITLMQMVGVLIGALVSGQIADRIGRKKATIAGYASILLFTFCTAFVNTWQTLVFLRFMVGVAIACYLTPLGSYSTEYIAMRYRTVMQTWTPFWSVGSIIFGVTLLFTRDWQLLAYISSCGGIPILILLFFIPESARWLLTKGRFQEGEEVLRKLAQWNRKDSPESEKLVQAINKQDVAKKHTYISMLKMKDFRYKNVAVPFTWLTCATVSYGLVFGVTKLSGTLGVNMALFGLLGIGAAITTYVLSKWLYRRWMMIFWLGIGGTFAALNFILYYAAPDIFQRYNGIFAIISKTCVSGCWTCNILITTEAYPTSIRVLGFGMASAVGRLGTIMGTQLDYVRDYNVAVPYALYAVLMYIDIVMVYFLPDTYLQPLQDFCLEDLNSNNNEIDVDNDDDTDKAATKSLLGSKENVNLV